MKKKLLTMLMTSVFLIAMIQAVTAVSDDYFKYADIAATGNAIDGYELNKTAGLLYVDRNGGYCDIYQVSIPDGSDPDMHPLNPYSTGTMAPRTFTLIDTYYFRGDTSWSGGHHAEFYVDADHDFIYYGVYTKGIEKWVRNSDGTFGTYLGKVTDKDGNPILGNGDETLGYDVDNNVWYSCDRNRNVYSFDADVDTAWKFEFKYPSYAGSHHDGMEFANGYLWVSDMTSNYIGQWEKVGVNNWTELNRFTYSSAHHVEGMGFEPLGHFWVTSGSRLYELGGGELQEEFDNIPDQCILAGASFETFDLDNYTSADHFSYSGNVDLNVSIDPADNVVTINYTSFWTGSETITFTSYDADNNSIDNEDATFEVCPVPVIGDIPGQTTPFATFDLDYYLLAASASPVTWSSSLACTNWTVDIDANNTATVTAPDGATAPCDITFTATSSCCGSDVTDSDTATFIPNQPPNVTNAYPSIDCIWPPNNKFVDITIEGVTDPDGDAVTINITNITSDEPTASIKGAGGKNHAPDAAGVGTATVEIRAERSGTLNGRVYEISFVASDGTEETEGSVTVCVPHDVRKGTCNCVDDGQNYDATIIN